jgi:hypothetical protein
MLGAAALMAAGCGREGEPEVGREVALAPPTQGIVFGVGASDDADPMTAGCSAATAAADALGGAPVKLVLVSECFEDRDPKAKVLEGVTSVFDPAAVFGSATYGSLTQEGVWTDESVAVLAIGGPGIEVASACREGLGTAALAPAEHMPEIEKRLRAAGAELAAQLAKSEKGRLMIVLADAHSPKNGPLVEGIQQVTGPDFPLAGGSCNKNAGQSFIYYRGRMLSDAAAGVVLSGDFQVALAGRQAKENQAILATAEAAGREALKRLATKNARPALALAFDCAGRKGRLENVADERAAMRRALGKQLPLFGTYGAGEVGPADLGGEKPAAASCGVGWHVVFALVGW